MLVSHALLRGKVDADVVGSPIGAVTIEASTASSRNATLAVFSFTVFCSAFLLFQVQLVIAKYILPWFGGTPAVFTACILFFQVVLLLGYWYAHLVDRRLTHRQQAVVHSLLILLAVAQLAFRLFTWGSPLLPGLTWKPINAEYPQLRIVAMLLASVALPYFVVSTTGPLLQAWYGRVSSEEPYRLYALSNAGSLLALLTYPAVVEPLLHLRIQAQVWGVAFLVFGAGCIAAGWTAARKGQVEQNGLQVPAAPRELPAPTWGRKVLWLLLAGAGSLSLLATTNQICQDVAAVPLLWVLPLSLYLVSFVLCFSSGRWYSRTVWSAALGVATLLVCVALYRPGIPVVCQIGIYSFALLASCMVCHGELVQLKPEKEYLTSFYLFVAAGGALGGLFVNLVAPLVFRGFWEFQLSVWLSCILLCLVRLRDTRSWIYMPKPLLLAFCLLVVSVAGLAALGSKPFSVLLSLLAVAGLVGFMISGNSATSGSLLQQRRAAVFSTCFTAILLAAVLAYPAVLLAAHATAISRNFYGVLTVDSGKIGDSPVLTLKNGRITHGFQFSEATKKRTPTAYYTPTSGVGLVLTNHPGRAMGKALRVGVIGLGAGTVATYGIPGDYMRFYEINPEVIRIANSGPQGAFSFLSDSRAKVEVVPGDGRISLERELNRNETQNFDVLVIDAFTGDAIPVHLLTKEAFQLYLHHLSKPHGILAFHISNLAFDLSPVIARLAAEANMSAWLSNAEIAENASPCTWVVVAAYNPAGPVPGAEHMIQIAPNLHFPLWTDDYSNLVRVFRW